MLKIIRAYYFLLIALSFCINSCKDDDDPIGHPEDPTSVMDIDSNVYKTVKICDQVWMAENLRVTRFRNGDDIPYKKRFNWNFIDPGNINYGKVSDSDSIAEIYGYVYNWITINDLRGLSPSGWHIPSSLEWQELLNCLGGDDLAGDKLRENGTAHWDAPNTGATNESGFTALPGSIRTHEWIVFTESDAVGLWTKFWTSSECNDTLNYPGPIYHYGQSIHFDSYSYYKVYQDCTFRTYGLYVRCIKDN